MKHFSLLAWGQVSEDPAKEMIQEVNLTLLLLERPKLYAILAFLSAVGLRIILRYFFLIFLFICFLYEKAYLTKKET